MSNLEKTKIQNNIIEGLKFFKEKNFDKSEKEFKKIIKIYPNETRANFYLGAISYERQKYEESKNYILKVLSLDENHKNANFMLGLIFYKTQNYKEAKKFFEKTYNINNKDISVLNYFSLSLIKLKDFKKAEILLLEGIKIKPNFFNSLKNLGYLYLITGRTEECIQHLSKALELNSNSSFLYANLGTAYLRKSDLVKGKQIFEDGLKKFPNDSTILSSYSYLQLSSCEIEKGFKSYEKRKIVNNYKLNFAKGSKEWTGENLNGKTLLILSEQGMGDIIQFSRYLFLIKERYSVKIIFKIKKGLAHLFKDTDIELIDNVNEAEEFNYFQYLLSLPGIFYKLNKMFAPNVNFIQPNKLIFEKWKNKLKKFKGPKIGINWQGDPSYPSDFMRSIPLVKFEKLFLIKNLNFFSLVKGYGEEQINKIDIKNRLINYSNEIDNNKNSFEDTIAILKNLDLVISCDTSINHIASTMNVNTFLLLNYSPDWRWRINYKWYKNLKIFQQEKKNNWEHVIDNVKDEIEKLYLKN